MAKQITQKKILIENLPNDVKKWIPEITEPLNRFMEEVALALNNQITINDNMDAEIKMVVADGQYPIKFKLARKSKPKAAIIGQCREISESHTTITEALYLDWEITADGMFQINNIADLNASATEKFNVTILIFNG